MGRACASHKVSFLNYRRFVNFFAEVIVSDQLSPISPSLSAVPSCAPRLGRSGAAKRHVKKDRAPRSGASAARKWMAAVSGIRARENVNANRRAISNKPSFFRRTSLLYEMQRGFLNRMAFSCSRSSSSSVVSSRFFALAGFIFIAPLPLACFFLLFLLLILFPLCISTYSFICLFTFPSCCLRVSSFALVFFLALLLLELSLFYSSFSLTGGVACRRSREPSVGVHTRL